MRDASTGRSSSVSRSIRSRVSSLPVLRNVLKVLGMRSFCLQPCQDSVGAGGDRRIKVLCGRARELLVACFLGSIFHNRPVQVGLLVGQSMLLPPGRKTGHGNQFFEVMRVAVVYGFRSWGKIVTPSVFRDACFDCALDRISTEVVRAGVVSRS